MQLIIIPWARTSLMGLTEGGKLLDWRYLDDFDQAVSTRDWLSDKYADSIDTVVACTGPAAFSITRQALGFAQGYALARNLPIVTFSTMAAAACTQTDTTSTLTVSLTTNKHYQQQWRIDRGEPVRLTELDDIQESNPKSDPERNSDSNSAIHLAHESAPETDIQNLLLGAATASQAYAHNSVEQAVIEPYYSSVGSWLKLDQQPSAFSSFLSSHE